MNEVGPRVKNSNLRRRLNDVLENRSGLRVQPSPDSRLSHCRSNLLQSLSIDCIFDVGANKGQFSHRVRKNGYSGRIVSFEPTHVFADLEQVASQDDLWTVFNVALSNLEGQQLMHLASNGSLSSSLLRPSGILSEFSIEFSEIMDVDVKRLDSYSNLLGANNYLKLDVQGSEHKVLGGATETLLRFSAIEFESALKPMYEGESVFWEIASDLMVKGFSPVILTPTHWGPKGSLISLDSIFVKEDL
jgi:FkbM family methyltransferase